ncbi:MAG: DUF5916 domain-containing protein [Gemmatimonadota bacterium]
MLQRQIRRLFLSSGFAILLVARASALDAQPAQDAFAAGVQTSHEATAPLATAVRASRSITIDGRLTDEIWSSAPPVTDFTQLDPQEGAPATQPTEVRIAYDEVAIYIGAMLYDDGEIRTQLARRDGSMGESDVFEVILDSYHDHQTAYRFATNPSGMKSDALVSGGGGGDSSWDPVWQVATEEVEGGWSVEMRIPFSQLRFSRATEQTWGVQIERTIHRNQEQAQFAFTPKLEPGGVQRYGHLTGIRDIEPGRRLELLPYVTGRMEYVREPAASAALVENTLRDHPEMVANAGLDLKYRLSSNVTLDATVNPDFGQVEVDPAVINLTAFETRFQERRPFFIEGAEIFSFGSGGPTGSTGRPAEVLYSRRIGRSPQGSVPSGALYSDVPTATTILGAAKLTGKVGGGWSLGFLDAVTGGEEAPFIDADGMRREVSVEPAANYLVARARRDLREGATRFGVIFTAVNRSFSSDALTARLHSAAYTTGVDLVHETDDRRWRINGSFSPSLVIGEEAALVRTQQTSSRYFQRPDAEHLSVDPDATRMAGYYAMGAASRVAGAWTGRLSLGATSPGYEVNDIGFQSYADRLIVDTHFQYDQTRPGRLLRSWNVGGGPDNIWNYAGQHVMSNINLQSRYQWTNYWSSGWRVEVTPETYDDRLTRGGPMSRTPRGMGARADFSTDSRKPYRLSAQASYSSDEGGSWSRSFGVDLSHQPRENWSIDVGPSITRRYSAAQYVTAVSDPAATSTFGRRYVFAGIDQTTLGIDTRVNVTFSPTVSFELYAQPFLSSGKYGALKELAAPSTFDFSVYGEDVGSSVREDDGFWRIDPAGGDAADSFRVRDRDFTFRSLLGNAVFRWEWRPGSTLYVVWQQSREERLAAAGIDPGLRPGGELDFTRDARDLLGIRPNNIFAVKLNYWLNP